MDFSTAAEYRVLVVDDEPDISALVAYHLARSGYRVSTASTGAEGLKVAAEQRPDLVVLDLTLAGLSGYDVLHTLRPRPETSDVGVIVLTARREEAQRIEGLRKGADDYVTTPFSPEELVLRVGTVLRRRTGPDTLECDAVQLVGGRDVVAGELDADAANDRVRTLAERA